MIEHLKDLEPYVLQVMLGALALFGLLKDWRDYGEKFGRFKALRWMLLGFTVAVLLLTMYETHSTRKETRDREQIASKKDAASTKQIEVLTEQVRLEREENKHNSDGFRQTFDSLSQRYSDLAARVQNADLLREIRQTRNELKATQDKLTQPKPKLIASFWKADMSPEDAKSEINATRAKDGSVSIDIVTLNESDVAAVKGEIGVRICWACKYAKEPEGFIQINGSQESDRALKFDHILSNVMTQKNTIEVLPPSSARQFDLVVHYACENCVSDAQTLRVHIVPELRFPR